MKHVRFYGRSLATIKGFPTGVRRAVGHQLDRVQHGLNPTDWKSMPSIGKGVREIRIRENGHYRVIYVASFSDAVYVLHAFDKKTRKTSKQDVRIARNVLRHLVKKHK